jgi:hypothetical protein
VASRTRRGSDTIDSLFNAGDLGRLLAQIVHPRRRRGAGGGRAHQLQLVTGFIHRRRAGDRLFGPLKDVLVNGFGFAAGFDF